MDLKLQSNTGQKTVLIQLLQKIYNWEILLDFLVTIPILRCKSSKIKM